MMIEKRAFQFRALSTTGSIDLAVRRTLHRSREDRRLAVRSSMDTIEGALNLAGGAWDRGERLEAVAIIRDAIRRAPDARVLHAVLAEMWHRLGRPELAMEWALSANRIQPTAGTAALVARIESGLGDRAGDQKREQGTMFAPHFDKPARRDSQASSWFSAKEKTTLCSWKKLAANARKR
jgi:hypothetical protein